MNCLNLRELFGNTYRITFDEAYSPAHVPHDKRDPWMMQLPCTGRGVTIYPQGGNVLAVEVDGRRNIAKKLAALPGLRLWQEGDRKRTWLFDVSLFPQVAAIVQLKRRRQFTPEQREAMRQRLANYAFRSA